MSNSIIILISLVLILSYLFEITSVYTRIPTVIFLFIAGMGTKELTLLFNINVPDLSPILPFLGNIGLILIVLEGSLELDFKKEKTGVIGKSFALSLVLITILGTLISSYLIYLGVTDWKIAILNAIPVCVISSSIAIPSARNFDHKSKEFIIYESSFSDIIGVLVFNFIALNETLDFNSAKIFGVGTLVMVLISFFASLGLTFLIRRIRHHVKFMPILVLVILIYSLAKFFHLPALIFILIFGLFIGNIEKLNTVKFFSRLRPESIAKEVGKLKELTIEVTFMVRTLFFVLFGFLLEPREIMNPDTILHALVITGLIFLSRLVFLLIFRQKLFPLLFIAPRGLITILLFLTIPAAYYTELMNNSLVIQIILLSVLLMMFGTMRKKRETTELINVVQGGGQ